MRKHRDCLTSEQVEVLRVEQLEPKQGEDDFNGERATVHKVPIEQLSAVVKVGDARA